ncbi:MAG: exodeoxyribonuclease VII small subunit [Lachnospiraceae bacterium]|nr:exodeoxyribonuclease VII small subunit [Lachnospiraceae bacterium]MBQ8261369.1 exodeoxyribonuclease VII small subunit [Lachnospiraceae bacterium]
MAKKQEVKNDLSLENKLDILEETISKMEAEEISMEESFALYKQGVVMLKECNEEIDRIEKKVLLLNESGETNEF